MNRSTFGVSRRVVLGGATGGAALLAAACGARATPGERSPVEGVTPGGKITWSFWAVSKEQADAALARIKDFHTQQPGIQVEAFYTEWGVYREKITAMISAGNPPEVTQVDAYWMPWFVEKQLIQRLDPYIRGDRQFKLDAFLPGAFLEDHHVFKGTYYAVPNSAESPRVLFYNKQRFAEAGLTLPNTLEEQGRWTWEAYLDAATKLSKGTSPERYYGTRYYLGVTPEPHAWVTSNGGKTLSDDRKSFVGDMRETLEAWQFQADLIHRHRVAPPPGESLGAGDPFISGRVAMFVSGIWAAAPLLTAQQSVGLQYGVAPLPKSPKGMRKTIVKPNASTIPAGVKGQPAATAWELIKFIAGPVYQKGQIDTGIALTNLKELVDYFLKQSPVQNARVFIDAYDKREVTAIPLIPKWQEYADIVNEEFGKVARGEASTQIVVGAIKSRANELLKS
jgi:multiple sugar transport system substrate-binding protein